MHPQLIEYVFAISERYRGTIRHAIDAGKLGIGAMHVRSLNVIAQTPDCTANQIVTTLGRDKAQVARLVKELLHANLIKKTAHPQDKRSQVLSLDSAGTKLMAQLKEAQKEIQSTMTQGLSTKELNAFEDTAKRLADNLTST